MNSVPIRQAIRNWQRFAGVYERFIESLPSDKLHIVRYEQLVSDYEAVLNDLLRSMGLSMDDACRHYVRKTKTRIRTVLANPINMIFPSEALADGSVTCQIWNILICASKTVSLCGSMAISRTRIQYRSKRSSLN